jgi:hypothetical protein
MKSAWLVVAAPAVLLLPPPALCENAQSPPAGASTQTRALAVELAEADGTRERVTKRWEALDDLVAGQIDAKLLTTDPETKAKVAAAVHDTFSPILSKSLDAFIDAEAADFSADELRDVIAFVKSPTSRAEAANSPILKQALAGALSGSPASAKAGEEAARVFAQAPASKRALVRRIFAAQDFEAHTRSGYAALSANFARAFADSGLPEPPQSAEAKQAAQAKAAKDADDYVKFVLEVEERNYVDNFSEAQLAVLADYLESPAGRAMATRTPKIRGAMLDVIRDDLPAAFKSLTDRICATVGCSAEQRVQLADYARFMGSELPRMSGLAGG